MFESLQQRKLSVREQIGAKVAGWRYVGSMPASQFYEMEQLWLAKKAAENNEPIGKHFFD